MNVGASLRALQSDRVIANVDIARTLGVHVQTISRWRSYTDLQASYCQKLAAFFGLTVDEFLSYGEVESIDVALLRDIFNGHRDKENQCWAGDESPIPSPAHWIVLPKPLEEA